MLKMSPVEAFTLWVAAHNWWMKWIANGQSLHFNKKHNTKWCTNISTIMPTMHAHMPELVPFVFHEHWEFRRILYWESKYNFLRVCCLFYCSWCVLGQKYLQSRYGNPTERLHRYLYQTIGLNTTTTTGDQQEGKHMLSTCYALTFGPFCWKQAFPLYYLFMKPDFWVIVKCLVSINTHLDNQNLHITACLRFKAAAI